jgi:hypothetical protein
MDSWLVFQPRTALLKPPGPILALGAYRLDMVRCPPVARKGEGGTEAATAVKATPAAQGGEKSRWGRCSAPVPQTDTGG